MHRCMVCGGTRTLVKGGEVVVCVRCLAAVHKALKPKLSCKFAQKPCIELKKRKTN